MRIKTVILTIFLTILKPSFENSCPKDSKQVYSDFWGYEKNKFEDKNISWAPQFSRNILEYELISKTPTTFVYRFIDNSDVSVLFYPIPEDVEDAIFTFVAHEIKLNSAGGDCKPRDVEVILKQGSFPVVNPTNVTSPAHFISEESRPPAARLLLSSDDVTRSLPLSPAPGGWYGTVYVAWTDPKLDAITQQGLTSDCLTILYTDVMVRKSRTTKIDCSQIVEINISNEDQKDIYKCFIEEKDTEFIMNVSISSECLTCTWAVVSLQANKIPNSDDNILQCAIRLSTTKQNIQFVFSPHQKKWHYLKIEYSNEIIDTATKIEVCKNLQALEAIDMKDFDPNVVELIRIKRNGYFSVDYQIDTLNSVDVNLLKIDTETIKIMKFDVFPVVDIGGTVTMKAEIKRNATDENDYKIVVCIAQGTIMEPLLNETCLFNNKLTPASLVTVSNLNQSVSGLVHIPFPEPGSWFVTLAMFCNENSSAGSLVEDLSCNTILDYSISSSSCIEGSCGRFGYCNTYAFNGYLMSCCICLGGYMGFDCSSGINATKPSETLGAILFLTLSNLLFIPSIVFAIRRRYYTEAVVYAFTMIFSTFYHACDAADGIYYGYCIVRMGVLQYCDFFCGLLSFWVTLIAMADLNTTTSSILHIFGVVIIAFGTELNKLSVLVFVIPIVIAVAIVLCSWGWRCWKSKRIFPAKIYWLVFLPVGLVLVVVGLLCFTIFQTNANYYIVHSIWHMIIALSVVVLLPTKLYFFPKEEVKTISRDTEEVSVGSDYLER